MAVALVSTVDSMPDGFPSHCVILFETDRDAVAFAVDQIMKYDQSVKYVADEAMWKFGDDHYDNPVDLLNAWQESRLGDIEYFHIKRVVATPGGAGAWSMRESRIVHVKAKEQTPPISRSESG